MKAAQIHGHGSAEMLRYEATDEPRVVAPTDVIVKLEAAAVNRIDIEFRRGERQAQFTFPHVLGCDGAGRIAAVGSAVDHVGVGDAVCLYPLMACGRCEPCLRGDEERCTDKGFLGERDKGTYAGYAKVPAKNCFPIPIGFSFEQAAAFPLVYATAWRLLVTKAEIKPGEIVLIAGIGGGIATAALQIAASIGAHILVTSANEEKLAKARALGCEYGINSEMMDVAKEVRHFTTKRGVDLVIDCVGGDSWAKSLASLARGGRLVTCGAINGRRPSTDVRRIFWNNLKIFGVTQSTRDEFCQLLKFFAHSGVKPIIDTVYPLKEAAKAHQHMESRKQFGKIVLRVDA